MYRLLFLLCLTLAACGRVKPPADFVFITNAAHNSRDPQKMSYMIDIRLTECLLKPLVELDYGDMSITPATAASWDVSDDGKTYTFHLRPDAVWSNGDPVTAHDFIYAWRRGMCPDLGSPYADLLFYIRGAAAFNEYRADQIKVFAENVQRSGSPAPEDRAKVVWDLALDYFDQNVGLHAPDDRTLVVELEHPTPYFLSLAAFSTYMPVHAKSVEAATFFDRNTGRRRTEHEYWRDPDRFVTNGPYVLGGVKFRQYAHLVKSPTYWDRDRVMNNSIRELIVEDVNTALLLYERGQADFWPGAPGGPMGEDLLAQHRPDVHAQAMAGTYYYNYNCAPTLPDGRDNPLKDVRVRRALSMGIDRAALVRVTGLGEPPATTFVPPDALANYHPPVEHGVTFDPQAARKLLTEAGYDNPATLTGLSVTYETAGVNGAVAEVIQNMWRTNLGVDVKLEPLDAKAAAERKHNRQYTISRASWFGDYPDPNTWLEIRTSTAPNNQTNWSNKKYDGLIAASMNEMDPDKRLKMLYDAERLIVEEQPMALLYHYVFLNLYDERKVHGLEPNAWGRWKMENVTVDREK